MRYLPKSPADREEMLAEIGVASIDDLFSSIPAELKSEATFPQAHFCRVHAGLSSLSALF